MYINNETFKYIIKEQSNSDYNSFPLETDQ